MSDAASPTFQLRSGAQIPLIGLGTWPMDDAESERAVVDAAEAGYRLFDTAFNYGNEVGVGRGVAATGLAREDMYVTTKFNKEWHARGKVREACEQSLERLGLSYLDLFLVHWPVPQQDLYVEAMQGLVDLQQEGLVRSIGGSNFTIEHLERIERETGIVPDVNQVQIDPQHNRPAEREYHREHGIFTQAWSPIGRGGDLLKDPVLTGLAEHYGRTPAQVALRWAIEIGIGAAPKSGDPRRIAQNIDLFSFALTPEEVASLTALDQGTDGLLDPATFGH